MNRSKIQRKVNIGIIALDRKMIICEKNYPQIQYQCVLNIRPLVYLCKPVESKSGAF